MKCEIRNINDGGPAFPTMTYDQVAASNGIGISVTDHPGMTLRDYFAAKAMQGICADPEMPTVERTAELAYRVADAMLKARENINDH